VLEVRLTKKSGPLWKYNKEKCLITLLVLYANTLGQSAKVQLFLIVWEVFIFFFNYYYSLGFGKRPKIHS
jgi:hypothetical protein